MKRIGILTAGGDTPALNATIHGAVVRANQLRIEIYGLIKGFNCLFNPRVPHVHLNPLFQEIPELDPTKGGTLIGSSRDYVDPDKKADLDLISSRLAKLGIEGLIAIGGDGTLNGAAAAGRAAAHGARAQDDRQRSRVELPERARRMGPRRRIPTPAHGYRYKRTPSNAVFDLNHIVNYATPGYATAVLVTAQGVERIRTTAESHRRIAIIEVMGRHSGYIALGTAYGQPDIILVPEHPLDMELLVERVKHLYDLQKNVVIVCGEGVVDEEGNELGAESTSTDPAGNVLADRRGRGPARADDQGCSATATFSSIAAAARRAKRSSPERSATRSAADGRFCSIGSTRRSSAPRPSICSSRAATTPCRFCSTTPQKGFHVEGYDANRFRDRWGLIHARQMHPAFYDPLLMKPSRIGIDYLLPIFTDAIGNDDAEHMRQTLFDPGNLAQPYHSINTDVHKRIRYIDADHDARD